MVTVRNPAPRLSNEFYEAMQAVLDALFNAKDTDGADLSAPFHDLLSKRQYPDYYKLIKSPQALNPVQNSVRRKSYISFPGFVRDCTQIFHNARVYNRPGSVIYQDAETLEKVLIDALAKCVALGAVPAVDAELPDLGALPPPSPELSAASPEQEVEEASVDEEEEEEEEEEDDDDDDEEDDTRKRRGAARARRVTRGGSTQPRTTRRRTVGAPGSTGGVEVKEEDLGEESGRKPKDDPRRKRGRPPRVDTPMETRIKNVLKALRKLKDEETGYQRLLAFEKLPEKKEFPEYFTEIKNPIALDVVRKNIKRRMYKSLEHFIKDMDLMFDNAKAFNEDDSQLYQDAAMLQEELHKAEDIEKAKTDEELAGGEEGSSHAKNLRIPLAKIEHKGETYRVGDWIHIVNPNDPNKPTVAQVFRTWKDPDGQVWINACWYYRPEQTVHWVEKKFYPEEVVKTGQYRDHNIDEVLGKCFVMFFTRFSRGRPKGIDETKCPIYVCESRYNETEKHLNKIKTWKSCIPDEVRNDDYELVPFDKQRTLKKIPSPIAHTLSPNAKEGDPLPEAKMGVENAPPVVGAVFKRARRETDSPPPEPTPPPPPAIPPPAPTPARQPNPAADYHETMSMTQMYKQAHMAATVAAPLPQHPPQTPAPSIHPHQLRTPAPNSHYAPSPTHYTPTTPLQRLPSNPGHYQYPNTPNSAAIHAQHQQQMHRQQVEQMKYNPPATPVVFTLPESVTNNIPEETAERFLRDAQGQMLWFTVPPLDNSGLPKATNGVGHSVQYLAKRKELEARREMRAKVKQAEVEEAKRKREESKEDQQREAKRVLIKALGLIAGRTGAI